MLSRPEAVAPHPDAIAPFESTRFTPAGHVSPPAPRAAAEVTAPPVIITEHELLLATAATGTASQAAVARRPWVALLWQRLSLRSGEERVKREPRRHYPPLRSSYFERAAMSREMDRL